MCEDGWLIGYGMATALYAAPVVERSHARLPAVLWARSCLRPGALIVPEITSILGRPLPGRAAARGADPLGRRVTRARPDDRATASRPVHRVRGENVTSASADRPAYRYRIRVRGRLGETIRSAFPALQARASGGDTVLTGPLPDRAALYGVLAQLEALGLELLEVRRLPPA